MSDDIIIDAVSPRVRYVADGTTTAFSFVFPIFSEQDMNVYIDDTLIKSGYSVTGAGNSEGGEVVFASAPQNGKIITLLRNLEIKRTSDFQESGAFRAKAINHELDYQIACLQQLNEQISRSVSFPPYSESAQMVKLPVPENGKAIVWDQNGASLRNSNLAYDELESLMVETKETVLASEANVLANQTSAQNAKNNAAASAELARTWAVGTQDERAEGSAKRWAEEAKSYAETTSSTGLYNRLSNCILEIPQNIKLALNNNVITLKAGSKLYKPNGKGNFSEIAISSDINFSAQNFATAPHNLVLLPNGTLQALKLDQTFSGQTAPIPSTKYAFWYDTVNNLIKYTFDTGATWQSGCSFPLVVINIVNGIGITSYEPPFNGFGFIGSCLFALPGVKLLMPNGRNSDGSLNNFEYTTLNPAVSEEIPGNNDYFLGFTSGGGFKRNQVFSGFYVSDSFISTSSQWCLLFNTTDNFYYSTGDYGATWNKYTLLAQIGIFTGNNGKISRLNVRQPFRAANEQESAKVDADNVFTRNNTFKTSILSQPAGMSIPNLIGYDAAGNKVGDMLIGASSNGSSYSILRINNSNGSLGAQIGYRRDASGNIVSEMTKTPALTANDSQITTTSWTKSYVKKNGGVPNWAAKITEPATMAGWTAPSAGMAIICARDTYQNANLLFYINDILVFSHGMGSAGSSVNGIQVVFLLGEGDKISYSHDMYEAIFIPYI